jgi:hypothetical protein
MPLWGAFKPDHSAIGSGVCVKAQNVYATGRGFGPMPSFSSFGIATAIPANCRGLFFARTSAGAWLLFAGTTTHLYKLVSGVWTDYSDGVTFAVPDDEFWSATQFGSYLIVSNSVDGVYSINVDSAETDFTAHTGSPPDCRVVRAVGGYLFLCGVTSDEKLLKWSADGDSTDFALDPAGTGASERSFPTGGRVLTIHGDLSGYILQEQSVRSFQQIPSGDFLFDIDAIEGLKGATGPYSSVSVGQSVFAHLQDGFYELGPGGVRPIGAEAGVNEWFAELADATRLWSMVATADPIRPHVIWSFYTTSGIDYFDRLLIYNWQRGEWSYSTATGDYFAGVATPGVTLEGLDAISGSLDALAASLDARQWEGDAPSLACVSSSGDLQFANGPNLEAVIESDDVEPAEGGMGYIDTVEPQDDANAGSLRLAHRQNDLLEDETYTGVMTLAYGRFHPDMSARTFRFERTIPAGTTWSWSKGVRAKIQPDGGF